MENFPACIEVSRARCRKFRPLQLYSRSKVAKTGRTSSRASMIGDSRHSSRQDDVQTAAAATARHGRRQSKPATRCAACEHLLTAGPCSPGRAEQESYVEQFRRILDAKKAWNEEEHGAPIARLWLPRTCMHCASTQHLSLDPCMQQLLLST